MSLKHTFKNFRVFVCKLMLHTHLNNRGWASGSYHDQRPNPSGHIHTQLAKSPGLT